jgi:hypothetical protein
MTSYFERKFWPKGANAYDKQWNQYRYATPIIRLADVYLMYAEAMNEVYGPTGTDVEAPMTAVEALNVVRARSMMPPVADKFTVSKQALRVRIRNERSVELCFEGHRWNDMRRWHIAHLPEYKIIYDMEMDKEHTYFKKVVRAQRTFDERHYWFPVFTEQTQLYKGWPQNPGW